jgi:NAD(P)H-dependent flavin oxidoreductase YrpB (nitropropane dioxygenase family)
MASANSTIGGHIVTPLTTLLQIEHPILLAGMANIANAELAAAVCNAGGMGVMGGVSFTPQAMRKAIEELKEKLNNKNASFGIDLLIPQVGGSARKTNKDYTVCMRDIVQISATSY